MFDLSYLFLQHYPMLFFSTEQGAKIHPAIISNYYYGKNYIDHHKQNVRNLNNQYRINIVIIIFLFRKSKLLIFILIMKLNSSFLDISIDEYNQAN
jgi:hypothetical protein